MGKARRIILFVFGSLQAGFGWFLWFVKSFMTGRAGTPRSYELAEEVVAAMEANGGSVSNADSTEIAIVQILQREMFAQADRPLFHITLFAVSGIACMLIAIWPVRSIANQGRE